MRNLLQYPITLDEKISVLEGLRDDLLAQRRMGDIRPAVLAALLDDLRPTPRPVQRQLALAPVETPTPGDIIAGPRIPLRYGSAATMIRISTQQWREVERGHTEWISIDDYTRHENLIGKRVSFKHGDREIEGIAEYAEELDDLFQVRVAGGSVAWGFHSTDQVTVVGGPLYLNAFEKAVVGVRAEQLGHRHMQGMLAVIEKARQYRLDMKTRIKSTGGDLRASLLKEFGWTEEDLKEVA